MLHNCRANNLSKMMGYSIFRYAIALSFDEELGFDDGLGFDEAFGFDEVLGFDDCIALMANPDILGN